MKAEVVKKVAEKIDAEKLSAIVEAAANPEQAYEKVYELYPEVSVKELREKCNFVRAQVDAAIKDEKISAPQQLTNEELEQVAGGVAGGFIHQG